MQTYKHLEWDSDFFGYRISSFYPESITPAGLAGIIQKLRDDNIKLVYCFVNPADKISGDSFSSLAISTVDEKTTFTKVTEGAMDYKRPPEIVSYDKSYVSEKLKDLTLQSGVFSRFKIDPGFTDNEYEKLYLAWIEKSVKRELADEILVYQENEEINGFITLKADVNAGRGSLGLLAVDEKMRGKSIGKQMLDAAEEYFLSSGINIIDVVTQKKNRVACSFYEKSGYKIKEITNIYHLWIS